MQQREKSKNQQVLAYASILTAAALWGIIGIWNRNLMGLGLSPTGIVLVRNLGGRGDSGRARGRAGRPLYG